MLRAPLLAGGCQGTGGVGHREPRFCQRRPGEEEPWNQRGTMTEPHDAVTNSQQDLNLETRGEEDS